jgi:hypothetical protein
MLKGNEIKLSNGKTVKITVLNAVQLHLDTSNIAFLNPKKDDSDHIVSITLEDKLTIDKGEKFLLRVGTVRTVYEVEYMIIEKKGKSVIIYTSLPTKACKFLLPALGKTKEQLKLDTYFVNAYLDPTYEYLCLMYRFTGSQTYKEFERYMITDPLCVSHLEHGKYHVVYIFKIPLNFKEDVVSLIEGKYSKFSKALKGRIRKFYGRQDSEPFIDVIERNEDLRKSIERYIGMSLPEDSELASKPDEKNEIYMPYE